MPNRIIKESICTRCEIERLSWAKEVYWDRLLIQCDDYGRMDGRPEVLRARCFPIRLERVSSKDVDGFKKALIEAGLIQAYVTDGKPFIQVTKWEKHQQIRAKRSKFPSPDNNGNQLISDAPVIQSESEKESESEKKENSKEKKSEIRPQVLLTATELFNLVDQFGEAGANERIEAFSLSKIAHGYKYKSDYHAILTWARKDKPQTHAGNGPHPRKYGEVRAHSAQVRGDS